jgi:predicted O-methyltransferase YrrM
MKIENFVDHFDAVFPKDEIWRVTEMFEETLVRSQFDTCPDVPGMTSPKKQKLLEIAFSYIEDGESYFEIGTYLGKSIISAAKRHASRSIPIFACDNFSEFGASNNQDALIGNLKHYGLKNVTFYNGSFRDIMDKEHVSVPVGLYFYDGGHSYNDQYDGIKMVEPLLSNKSVVVVDDWRFAPDSMSYACQATLTAIAESKNNWEILYSLPARKNADVAMWWNGVAVFSFTRK